MVKLVGKAKAAFLARMNRGRKKKGLKIISSKQGRQQTILLPKRSKKRSNSTKRSGSSLAKQKSKSRSRKSTMGELYDKKKAKVIAIKAGIGVGVGLAIRLGTMFFQDRNIREVGARAAATGAAYLGGGSGELAYQVVDAGVSRLIVMGRNGGGGGVNVPNPLLFGGA